MHSGTSLCLVIFLGVAATIYPQESVNRFQTGSSSQGRIEGPTGTELANYTAWAKDEMHQAMVLSYAVKDTDISRSPATILAEVNERLSQVQETFASR